MWTWEWARWEVLCWIYWNSTKWWRWWWKGLAAMKTGKQSLGLLDSAKEPGSLLPLNLSWHQKADVVAAVTGAFCCMETRLGVTRSSWLLRSWGRLLRSWRGWCAPWRAAGAITKKWACSGCNGELRETSALPCLLVALALKTYEQKHKPVANCWEYVVLILN